MRRTVVAVFLCLYFLLAVIGSLDKSATFDEMVHLLPGYAMWRTNDYRLATEAGNLPCRWMALPLLAGSWSMPATSGQDWMLSNKYQLGKEFLYGPDNDADAMLLRARAMTALLGVALGLLVYLWARSLYGAAAGLAALALFAFSPDFLAHGGLVTADLASAFFLCASAGALWALLQRVTALRLASSCLAVSALLLTKNSGIIIVPMGVILMLLRLFGPGTLEIELPGLHAGIKGAKRILPLFLGIIGIHLLVFWACAWSAYGMRYSAFNPAGEKGQFFMPWEQTLADIGAAKTPIELCRKAQLLPEAWLHGLAFTFKTTERRRSFLEGDYSLTGWWYFFPYCFAVKTPLGLLILLAAAAFAAFRTLPANLGGALYRSAPLWVIIAVYSASSLASNLNIGHRHLLPIYPPLFILAASLAASSGRLRKAAAAALVVGACAESLVVWPHSLAFFNAASGGPQSGFRRLVDSSLDWGQDLPTLARWLEKNRRPNEPVYLSYFGTASPAYHGVNARMLPGFFDGPRPGGEMALGAGLYCVSATMLQGLFTAPMGPWAIPYEKRYRSLKNEVESFLLLPEKIRKEVGTMRGKTYLDDLFFVYGHMRFARLCAYLRKITPDADAGHSILIFRLSEAELDRALEYEPAELLPETPPAIKRVVPGYLLE